MRRRFPVALAIAVITTAAMATLVARPVGAVISGHRTAVSDPPALPAPAQAEGEFVARINALRSSRGLGTLQVDGELTAAARSWASVMAGEGHIFHASDLSAGVSARWAKIGENVGVGYQTGSLFDAFVASPSHLENLVDPAYTRVGVGVVVSDGRMFTTHRFMAVQPTPPPTTTAPPAPPTTAPPAPPPTTPTTTTTAPTTTTTTPVTTTTEPPRPDSKLGPIERLGALVDPD